MPIGGLEDYAQALGLGQRLVPGWRDGDFAEAQLAGQRQALAHNAMVDQQAAQDQQYKLQRRDAFNTGLQQLGAKPSAQAYRQLGAQFPEFREALEGAAKGVATEQAQSMVRRLAPVQSLIAGKNYDAAAAEVKRHIDADKNAGIAPDEDDQHLYDELTSGDPARQQAAGGIVSGLLYSLDPENAAKNVAAGNETHVINPGGALVDGTGRELYRAAPTETNALEVPIYDTNGNRVGTQLVANGGKGGDPSSVGGGASGGSGAPSGRTQFGWTPRARHGGDNTDAAVDGKLNGMTQALGVGVDQPFPASMSNRQIFDALTISEGGKGSLADRNNNPGNLTDARTGAYRKFPTKEAGIAAGVAQVARNRARGQNSIRTMVEGVPVGGRSVSSSGGTFGPVAAASGSGYQVLSPQENTQLGLDPNVRYQRAPNGQITALGGQKPNAGVKQLTEGQSKAVGLLGSAVSAARSLGQVRGYRPSIVALALNDLSNGNPIKQELGQSDRRVLNAQLAFSNAILRLESGAAISKDETAKKAQTLFPLPGDGPDVQEDKRQQREAAIRALRVASGPGAETIKSVQYRAPNAPTARQAAGGFSHLSASGKYGWNGKAWVAVR